MIDCLKQRMNYYYGCILYTPLRLYGTGWISGSQLFHLALTEDDAAIAPITFVRPYPRLKYPSFFIASKTTVSTLILPTEVAQIYVKLTASDSFQDYDDADREPGNSRLRHLANEDYHQGRD